MRVLVVGGASSGKSAFAEEVALALSSGSGESRKRVYLATMQPFGEEGARRIERHRRLRAGKGFTTIECCRNLAGLDAEALAEACGAPVVGRVLQAAVLVEDLGNLLANELFSDAGAFERGDGPLMRADAGIRHVEECFAHVVVVANDVGRAAERFEAETQAYLAQMGALNCRLAARFDVVVEVMCGAACAVKGERVTLASLLSGKNGCVLAYDGKDGRG